MKIAKELCIGDKDRLCKIFVLAVLVLFIWRATAHAADREQAERFNKSGVERFSDGDIEDAIEYFSLAIEADVEFSDAYLNRAASFFIKGGGDAFAKQVKAMTTDMLEAITVEGAPKEKNTEIEKENEDKKADTFLDKRFADDCEMGAKYARPAYIYKYESGEMKYYSQVDLADFGLVPDEERRKWKGWMEKVSALNIGDSTELVRSLMGEPTRIFGPIKVHEENGLGEEPENRVLFYYAIEGRFLYFQMFCGMNTLDSEIVIEFIEDKVVTAEACPNFRIKFDHDDWMKSSPRRRRAMIDDFIEIYKPETMTKEQLIEELGTPSDYSPFGKVDLIYNLGPNWNSMIPVDDDWFVVDFDDNGVVEEFAVQGD